MDRLYITLGLLNAWSIVNKTALIHDAIEEINLDLFALVETFVYADSPDVHKFDCAPEGFSVLHQHREGAGRGGRIALVHKNNIETKHLDVGVFIHCEILAVRVGSAGNCFNLVIIYRPPSSSIPGFIDELDNLLGSGVPGNSFVVCGDLNCPGHKRCCTLRAA